MFHKLLCDSMEIFPTKERVILRGGHVRHALLVVHTSLNQKGCLQFDVHSNASADFSL